MDIKYLKSIGIYIVSAIISLLLIAYILIHLFGDFDSEIETMAADTVTGRELVTLNGYIMRSEQILFSSEQGDINALYDDGKRVTKNAPVVNVYASGGVSVRSRIIELDRQIGLLESSNLGENITISDTKTIDGQIAELYSVIHERIESGDLEYALRKKDDLLVLLNRRRIIVQNVENYDDMIMSLSAQRNTLTSQLTDISETVRAPEPGYFYSGIDGYEEIFSSADIDEMTIDEFYAKTEAEPLTSYTGGYGVGKLVTDYYWYTACPVPVDMLRFFTEDARYTVVFPYSSDEELSMTLTRIIVQTDDDRAVLIFGTGIMPENFNYLRMQTIDIVRDTYTGYRVPVSAVRIVNGVQGVYTLSGNYVRFKPVEPLFESEGYFIVRKYEDIDSDKLAAALLNEGAGYLAGNDLIITKGKKLYDRRIVE